MTLLSLLILSSKKPTKLTLRKTNLKTQLIRHEYFNISLILADRV